MYKSIVKKLKLNCFFELEVSLMWYSLVIIGCTDVYHTKLMSIDYARYILAGFETRYGSPLRSQKSSCNLNWKQGPACKYVLGSA